jgi:murein DD-endopeptidase MepM/ murein hydrolase activator NlpD
LYQRNDQGFGQAGLTVTLSLDQVIGPQPVAGSIAARSGQLREWLSEIDWVPDLGVDIGSRHWFRGLATCTLLCAATVMMSPGFRSLPGHAPSPLVGDAWEETRAQSIGPQAWGGDTGRRMAATDAVVALGDTPERPSLDMTATLGQGDGFRRVLERAGVGGGEASRVADMVARISPLSEIEPGTLMKLTLGRRANRNQARPLDALQFRARFDLTLMLSRSASGALTLTQIPIAIDRTPLRIQGRVGDSLYRSARAAGVPAKAVEAYIRAIASKLSISNDVNADHRFDMIVEQQRAETGEVKFGKLLYAGLDRGNRTMQLLQWTIGGRTEWFEASGVGEKRGGMTLPVSGARLTSGFGMRFHPLLGYTRLHRGVDYGAVYGSPIHAVTDGLVNFAGGAGGYGRQVRIAHAGGLGTSYSHMSRIIVSPGTRVRQGQVIGYVGSSGLSTGPHLHFEVYRNGQVIDPRKVQFVSRSLLEGSELAAFRTKLRDLLGVQTAGMVQSGSAGAGAP